MCVCQAVCTNYTRSFEGCIDYVFFDSSNMRASFAHVMPDVGEGGTKKGICKEDEFLPNSTWPSDHLCVICTLDL